MNTTNLIGKIKGRRVSFTTFKAAANYYNLPTSTGWSGIEEKLKADNLTPDQIKENNLILQRIFEDNIKFGDKAVQIARVRESHFTKLKTLCAHKCKFEFSPSKPFPEPMSLTELRSVTISPKLVHADKDAENQSLSLYFYAKGYETEKEEFPVDQMTDEGSRRRFAGFDHVIAYKQKAFLRIDAVCINLKHKHIEFKVDITHIRSLEQIEKAFSDLKSAFRKYASSNVDNFWEDIEFSLVNFYPKIDFVYSNKNGMVLKLGQNTASGAINYEKMRGMKGDLREETYHKAGKSAVATQAFSITTSFPYDKGYSRVHLSIPGKSAQASAENPTLTTAIIEDCFREEQFNDMINLLK